jgi:hypothetical protein
MPSDCTPGRGPERRHAVKIENKNSDEVIPYPNAKLVLS